MLTAASAKLVAKVFIRAGQQYPCGRRFEKRFRCASPVKVSTAVRGQP